MIKKSPEAVAGMSFWRRYRTVILVACTGFVAGFLWLAALRYLLVPSGEVHYHANFAVYINGEREAFKDFTYYEEVAACTGAYASNPKGRVHMHNQVNNEIHVHDSRVTYGAFFQNLGWNVGDNYLATRGRIYQTGTGSRLVFILNGEKVDSITNRLIASEDRLLVSFGPENTDFQAQFDGISKTAAELNHTPDPATCGGLNGTGYNNFVGRLKRATFWN